MRMKTVSERDFTEEELKYFKSVLLAFFKLFVPMLFMLKSIPLGDIGLAGNFAIHHLFTSFGTAVSAQVFLMYKPFNMTFAYHSYLNKDHYFPAIETELVDYPLSFGKFGMFFSPSIMIGLQPENQKFKTGTLEFLGLLGL
jgi:hypothetical protein